jgi:hypothetical protein
MTEIFKKEYHKEQAKICLKQAALENKTWLPSEWVKKNKPHRLIAAKQTAVSFWLVRAHNHIQIAMGNKPVLKDFILISPERNFSGDVFAK